MEISFFIKGLIFGFSIAAPVGPIGILCIRRSLTSGWRAGLLTGMGAATADGIYGCIAAFGLSGISGFLINQQSWVQRFGGLFLLFLGLKSLFQKNEPHQDAPAGTNGAMGYLSALLLTLTNPMTILSFAAVFAGMGLGVMGSGPVCATWLVAGVFSGSMAWWIILSSTTHFFKRQISPRAMDWVNRVSGFILTGFGILALTGRI